MAIEFGKKEFSLEEYLDQATSTVFHNHDTLSHFLDHLDPRLMVPFVSLEDRLIPLRDEDMIEVKKVAFIEPRERIMRINFRNVNKIFDNPQWWEVFGNNLDEIDVNKLNIDLTTIKLEDWKLVVFKRTKAYDDSQLDDFDYALGWVSDEEIQQLVEAGELMKDENE